MAKKSKKTKQRAWLREVGVAGDQIATVLDDLAIDDRCDEATRAKLYELIDHLDDLLVDLGVGLGEYDPVTGDFAWAKE